LEGKEGHASSVESKGERTIDDAPNLLAEHSMHGKHSQQPERRIGAFSVSLGRRIPGFQIPELELGSDPLIPPLVGSREGEFHSRIEKYQV
jgi:hypothetical protein